MYKHLQETNTNLNLIQVHSVVLNIVRWTTSNENPLARNTHHAQFTKRNQGSLENCYSRHRAEKFQRLIKTSEKVTE